MSKTVEDIGTLKINLLSQAQYDAEKAGGRLADDELYLTPSSGTGVSDVEVNGSSVVSGGVAEITINDIPSGGTTGQVLTKDSGTDYDVSWEDPSGGTITDVTVDGTSIVDDGVAELETVTQLRDGLMTATDKQKLDTIASGAEVNVQSNWAQSDSTADDYIKNKPTIPTITDTYSGTSSNGMSGKAVKSAIDALDGTVSGSAGSGKTLTAFSQTDGKVSATFGNISITKSQVSDFPTIPTVNDATLTIQKNGTTVNTFTANASSNVTANITVPTDTGDLTNGAGFITGVTSSSTPTASTIAEFDSSAYMNSTDMTSQEVSDFVDDLSYESEVATVISDMVDYVVEQGTDTDNGWVYRKWNSGVAECWGKHQKEVSANSADANNYKSFPFTFSAVPIINLTVSAGGADLYRGHIEGGSTNASQVRIVLINKHTASVTITAHIYVVGKWK